jgi:hypothetical protein
VGMGQRWGAKQWATWGRCACRQLCCSSRPPSANPCPPSLPLPCAVSTIPGPAYSPDDSYGHAVLLVGYDNRNRVWLARNSWSAAFADGGYFRIGFGVSGIASPTGTYGLRFLPSTPPQRVPPDLVVASAAHPGCLEYKAQAWDRIDGVARTFGVPLQRLLADNLASLGPTLSARPAGKSLLVCGAEEAAAELLPPRSQLEALLQIKAAIDKNDVLKSWAVKRSDRSRYCSWQGVKCDESGNVTALLLQSTNLGGVLPGSRALRGLPKLRSVTFNGTNIGTILPLDWAALTSLEEITVCNNTRLVGTLPPVWGQLASLRTLDLRLNHLGGTLPPEWASLQRLERVRLGGNQLVGTLPSSWSQMSHLQDASIESSRLFGPLPPEWCRLPQLRSLDMANNMLSGTLPPEWAGLARLDSLNLRHNKLAGTLPPEWASLQGLAYVRLEGNLLVGPLPPAWSQMWRLQNVSIASNRLFGPLPPEWCRLPQLRLLDMANNMLSGTLPPEWAGLARLESLRLRNNALAGTLPPQWGGGMHAVKTLHLDQNRLAGPLPSQWGGMRALVDFAVGHNNLSGTLPESWGAWGAVRWLDIARNHLTGTLPAAWGNMTHLHTLFASSNDFSGSLPESWGAMSSLFQIWLDYNPHLTGCLPHAWSTVKVRTVGLPASNVHSFVDGTQMVGHVFHEGSYLVANFC